MRTKYIINTLIVLLLAINTFIAQASVLTFDDLPPEKMFGGGDLFFGVVPDGYGGLNWSDNSAYFNATEDGGVTGFSNAPVSGDRIFAPGDTFDPVIISGETFNFIGAYFTASSNDGLNINVKGFNGATLLYDNTMIVNTSGPTWLELNQFGINRLEFISFGGVYNPDLTGTSDSAFYAMDNFTYSAVPIPSSIWLFSMGLIGLLKVATRR